MNEAEPTSNELIQTQIAAKAEKWRQQDPAISANELQMQQTWTALIPTTPPMNNNEILEQTTLLAHLDPQVPIKSRIGIGPLKLIIRKLTYWYTRFITDQFNTFSGMLLSWLHNSEQRISSIEHAISSANAHTSSTNLTNKNSPPTDVSPPSSELIAQIAALAGTGSCVVLSGGSGCIVQSINNSGGNAYGIEANTAQLLASLSNHTDVRLGDITKHLADSSNAQFDTIIFTGIVEVLPRQEIQYLIAQAARTLSIKGCIIVAVADPQNRTQIQSELYHNLGISRHLWQYLLEAIGMQVKLLATDDSRIPEIVVANWLPANLDAQTNKPSILSNSQPTVDILLPIISNGDATSNHTKILKNLLEDKGFAVRLITETVQSNYDNNISIADWKYSNNTTILQHCIGSPIADRIIQEEIPIILNYHNITPAHFFHKWHPDIENAVQKGRTQLQQLVPLTIGAIADSQFNAVELKQMGFSNVAVSPVMCELANQPTPTISAPSIIPQDAGTVLFVGRIAPNKCHQDLIFALAMLVHKRPRAKLLLIGEASPATYLASLQELAKQLSIENQIIFAGKVSDKDLLQAYQVADVFASTSEHEGFGVPLLEAMVNNLPVVAYDSAAVAETIQTGGILLTDKRPATLATALDTVLSDPQLRSKLQNSAIQSAQRFHLSVTRQQIWDTLEDLLAATTN